MENVGPGTCFHCGEDIFLKDSGWVGKSPKCVGSYDEEHHPFDEHLRHPYFMRRDIDSLNNKRAEGSSDAAYCAGCHSKFPASQGTIDTNAGESIIFCPICADHGKIFNELDGFTVSAGAPAEELTCQSCGEDFDPGDDNDTDPIGGVGDTCPNCGSGHLVLAAKADSFEMAPDITPDEQPGEYDGITPGLVDTSNAPRYHKPPRKMMRTQVDGLDKNNDGGGMQTMSSYQDLAKHIDTGCAFCRSMWRQGYNAGAIRLQHDRAHSKGAYAVDHEHGISDYSHGQMVSSSKHDILSPSEYWTEDDIINF